MVKCDKVDVAGGVVGESDSQSETIYHRSGVVGGEKARWLSINSESQRW